MKWPARRGLVINTLYHGVPVIRQNTVILYITASEIIDPRRLSWGTSVLEGWLAAKCRSFRRKTASGSGGHLALSTCSHSGNRQRQRQCVHQRHFSELQLVAEYRVHTLVCLRRERPSVDRAEERYRFAAFRRLQPLLRVHRVSSAGPPVRCVCTGASSPIFILDGDGAYAAELGEHYNLWGMVICGESGICYQYCTFLALDLLPMSLAAHYRIRRSSIHK